MFPVGRLSESRGARRALLGLLASGVVVTVGLAGLAAFSRAHASMVSQVQGAERLLAGERATALADTVRQVEAGLADSAGRPVVAGAVAARDLAGLDAALQGEVVAPGLRRLTVTDASDRVLVSYGGGRDLVVRRSAVAAAPGGRDALVRMAADVRDPAGHVVGRLHQEVSVGALQPDFASQTSMVSGLVTLVDRRGGILMTAGPGTRRMTGGELLAAVASGRPQLVSYHSTVLAGDRIAAVAPVAGTDAVVIAGADASEAYRPARDLLGGLALVTAVGTAIAVALVAGIGFLLRAGHRRLEHDNAASRLLAMTDPLTGAGNRRALDAGFRSARDAGRVVRAVTVDLDRFKVLNDTCGHPAGDDALRRAAGAMRSLVRGSDVVSRLGGDEFAILQVVDGADGVLVVERLRAALHDVAIDGFGPLDASIGSAVAGPGDDLDALMAAADRALYIDKRARHARAAAPVPAG